MRIAGHTMGTPECTLPEAIDLFARLEMEGIEAIRHDEYRSAIRIDVSAHVLRELRQRAGGQGLQFAAITPYATDLKSRLIRERGAGVARPPAGEGPKEGG